MTQLRKRHLRGKFSPFTEDLAERYQSGEITKEFWYQCEWEVQKRLIELAKRFGIDTSRPYFHRDIEYHMSEAYCLAGMREKEPKRNVYCIICGQLAGHEPIKPGIKDSVLAFCEDCAEPHPKREKNG